MAVFYRFNEITLCGCCLLLLQVLFVDEQFPGPEEKETEKFRKKVKYLK